MQWIIRGFMLLTLLLAISCGDPKLSHGTVIDKDYQDAYTTTYMQPQTNQCGKNCTYTTYYPVTTHHKAVWRLKLRDCSTDKCKEGYLSVGQAVYDQTKLGDIK